MLAQEQVADWAAQAKALAQHANTTEWALTVLGRLKADEA
jgi:hypothetical protein